MGGHHLRERLNMFSVVETILKGQVVFWLKNLIYKGAE